MLVGACSYSPSVNHCCFVALFAEKEEGSGRFESYIERFTFDAATAKKPCEKRVEGSECNVAQ